MSSEVESSSQAELSPNTSSASPAPAEEVSFLTTVKLFGKKIFSAMEYVGEAVAGVLGIDDSKFQWVIDGMSQEEWEAAQAVAAEREAQDAATSAAAPTEEVTYTDPLVPPSVAASVEEVSSPTPASEEAAESVKEGDIALQNV